MDLAKSSKLKIAPLIQTFSKITAEYHDFTNVFSNTEAHKLPEHIPCDLQILILIYKINEIFSDLTFHFLRISHPLNPTADRASATSEIRGQYI